MTNVERNMVKPQFQVQMRHMYWADLTRGEFDGTMYTPMRFIYKGINANTSHKLYCYVRSRYWHNPFDFGWQDFFDYRWNHVTSHMLDAWRRRCAFVPPHDCTGGTEGTPDMNPTVSSMVLSTEEMATLMAFPRANIVSPGIQRINSKTASAPFNLPR